MTKYIASFSGGKDSTASIILAHEHKEPLDMIIFSEVMFDKETSGELPEHIAFIKEKCIPLFESWGYENKILHADKTYMDCFNHIITKSKIEERNGKKQGFPMAGKCWANSRLKVKPVKDFLKSKDLEQIVQYVGIATDEPKRLERLKSSGKVSLLEKYGYTEEMAFQLCRKYDLLSPVYEFTRRGGCWFCPNARYAELKHLRTCHRNLWDRLLSLEDEPEGRIAGNMWNNLEKRSMKDNEEMFFWEEAQMSIEDFLSSIRESTEAEKRGGSIHCRDYSLFL